MFVIILRDFIYLFIFRDRGEGKEKEGEKHQCAIETWIRSLQLGT